MPDDGLPIPGPAPTPGALPATLFHLYHQGNLAKIQNILKKIPEQEHEENPPPTFVEHTERAAEDAVISLLQNIPEPIKKPLRQAVGRVAVNTIEPIGYGAGASKGERGSKLDEVMDQFKAAPFETMRNIIRDQPTWAIGTDSWVRARRPLFREFFDLPPEKDPENTYIRYGKHYRINPLTTNAAAREALDMFRHPEREMAVGERRYAEPPGFARNPISGSYKPGYPDPWDFDMHKSELDQFRGHPYNLTEFMRQAMTAIGHPAIVETGGYYNPPPREEGVQQGPITNY